jgi:hypothetical protein
MMIRKSRKSLEEIVKHFSGHEAKLNTIATIDYNLSSGIARVSKELVADIIVMNDNRNTNIIKRMVGDDREHLMDVCDKTIFFCHFDKSAITYTNLVIMAPPLCELENSFAIWVERIFRLAKELNIPIIALSQLSREVEKRADKRPMLSDLRQTGAIEQDADAVLFLYREDYYLKEQDGYTKTYQLEVIAAKLREGETGTMHLHYNPATKVIADSEPINTPVKEIYNVNPSTGEVFKTLDGKTTIDDFNSDGKTPF